MRQRIALFVQPRIFCDKEKCFLIVPETLARLARKMARFRINRAKACHQVETLCGHGASKQRIFLF